MTDPSTFAVALSLNPEPVAAATDAARRIKDQLAGTPVTLAVVFASPGLCTDPWSLLDALGWTNPLNKAGVATRESINPTTTVKPSRVKRNCGPDLKFINL